MCGFNMAFEGLLDGFKAVRATNAAPKGRWHVGLRMRGAMCGLTKIPIDKPRRAGWIPTCATQKEGPFRILLGCFPAGVASQKAL